MTWAQLATVDETKAGKIGRDIAVLLLRERRGDKAATTMLDNMTYDYTIANAAFTEIVRIIETNVTDAHFTDIDPEQYTARINDTVFVMETASVQVNTQSGKGQRRTILFADPKLFNKIEAIVKELVDD